ncbi:hypothetical protein Bp8pS_046 [Bacillus phage vB_BpuM-BpSp]|nr:hypothetical protein Bp8pS_046 [Bacillus phage vB_BpuM-BpSp]
MKNLISTVVLKLKLYFLSLSTKPDDENVYLWQLFTERLFQLFIENKINFNTIVKYKTYLKWNESYLFDRKRFYNKLTNEEINLLRDNKNNFLINTVDLLIFKSDIDDKLISMCKPNHVESSYNNFLMWENISINGKLSENFIKENINFLHKKELLKNKNINQNSKIVTLIKLEDI